MHPKVANGFGAAGGSTPVVVILVWLLGMKGVTVPPEVAAAFASLIAAGAALIAGYMTRPAPTVQVPVPVAVPVPAQPQGPQP